MVVTILVRDDLHLGLLECWCWAATRGGQPPPSHRGHLASVQGLGGGGQADWGNGGGKGQGRGQEQDSNIIVSNLIIISGVSSDLGDISFVRHRVCSVVLPHQHLDRGGSRDLPSEAVEGAVGCSQDVAPRYDGAATKRCQGAILWPHQANLKWKGNYFCRLPWFAKFVPHLPRILVHSSFDTTNNPGPSVSLSTMAGVRIAARDGGCCRWCCPRYSLGRSGGGV